MKFEWTDTHLKMRVFLNKLNLDNVACHLFSFYSSQMTVYFLLIRN